MATLTVIDDLLSYLQQDKSNKLPAEQMNKLVDKIHGYATKFYKKGKAVSIPEKELHIYLSTYFAGLEEEQVHQAVREMGIQGMIDLDPGDIPGDNDAQHSYVFKFIDRVHQKTDPSKVCT